IGGLDASSQVSYLRKTVIARKVRENSQMSALGKPSRPKIQLCLCPTRRFAEILTGRDPIMLEIRVRGGEMEFPLADCTTT
ncbi:MAG: hypothetical protein WAN42_08275, partial [Pseudolabrys sp.]